MPNGTAWTAADWRDLGPRILWLTGHFLAINCDKNTIEIFRFLLRNIQVLIGVNWLVGILEPNPILLPNSIG